MIRLIIYLDTSVISYLQQDDAPEKTKETLQLWEQFKNRADVEVVISDLVIREISRCGEPKLSFLLNKLAEIEFTMVEITEDVRNLAKVYLQNGVLREKSLDDLTHIAMATLSGCRYITSWNFKHFVNPKTIKAVNSINLSLNLSQVDIFPPSMMLGGF